MVYGLDPVLATIKTSPYYSCWYMILFINVQLLHKIHLKSFQVKLEEISALNILLV